MEIELAQVGHELAICVRNPAPPPREADHLPDLDGLGGPGQDRRRGGTRHAQSSIGQRLSYAFGPGARMTARWNEGYYQVDLKLPVGAGTLNK